MKKALCCTLVLGTAVAVSLQSVPFETVSAVTVSGNGDVNGDNGLDLSDAIYILTHLFQGGPAPAACPGAAGAGGGVAGSPLPATGQTKCYDDTDPGDGANAVEIVCENAVCLGQDGLYTAGCTSDANRFVVNDDTVKDNCTGLTWQRDTADTGGPNDSLVPDGLIDGDDRRRWTEALDYCENLTLGGRDDWRLPNVRELFSIVNRGAENPAIYDDFNFNENVTSQVGYWSSTPYIGDKPVNDPINDPDFAWEVTFKDGVVEITDGPNYVRAVRSAIPGDGAGGVTVSGNGDVNADNGVDLSDAIYILSHLFQGGPAPAPCGDIGPDSPSLLPATGVTKCYDDLRMQLADDPDRSASEIPCAQSGILGGQDGFYQAGCSLDATSRFFIDERGSMGDTTDDTVTDNCTGLMWQRDNPDGQGGLPLMKWCDALDYCETLDLGGHMDWRMPNIVELQSIVDYGRFDPALNTDVFVLDPGATNEAFWSSTLPDTSPGEGHAWLVFFREGNQSNVGRDGDHALIRAVRDIAVR